MLSSGYSSRPAARADLNRIGVLIEVAQQNDIGRSEFTVADIASEWSRESFRPERDAVVVEHAGEIVAYAQVRERAPRWYYGWGEVHPAHRARGLGSFVVDWTEQRCAVPAENVRLLLVGESEAEDARALFTRRGYAAVRRFWTMERVLSDERAPEPPEGITLRTVDPERDLRTVQDIRQEAFREHFGFHERDPDEAVAELKADPRFDPSLFLAAYDDDEMVGVLLATAFDDEGWIDTLGVLKRARGRGIAKSLLRGSFALFAERGETVVALSVDTENVTGAVALYESVGMRARIAYDNYEKVLSS